MDLALLILRVVVGLLFVGHGTQKLFGWFGGHGVEGTGGFFEALGYRPPRTQAALAGFAETAGGVLLALGLVLPLGAAMIIGVMVNAIVAVHWEHGIWATNGGIEYPLVNASVATALAFAGAGRFSLDAAIGWDLSGARWGLGALALGLISGVVFLVLRRPPAPAAEVRAGDERGQERHAA
jgi:putative oxidoreductase